MGKPQWSPGASIEKWGELTENAFINNNYNSSNNSIDIENHNVLKLGALAGPWTSVLPFPGLYSND